MSVFHWYKSDNFSSPLAVLVAFLAISEDLNNFPGGGCPWTPQHCLR